MTNALEQQRQEKMRAKKRIIAITTTSQLKVKEKKGYSMVADFFLMQKMQQVMASLCE